MVGPVNFESSPLEERSGGVEHEWINRPNLATNIVNITLLAIVLIGLIGCCFAAAALAPVFLPIVAVLTSVLGYFACSLIACNICEIREQLKGSASSPN